MLNSIVGKRSLSVMRWPLYACLFLYFALSAVDLLYMQLFLFRIKLCNLFGFLFLLIVLFQFRFLIFSKEFILSAVLCLVSLVVSALFGYHLPACLGFILMFVFNYLVFFVVPCTLFLLCDPKKIMYAYFSAFVCIGLIATIQVVSSFFGIILPGVTQYVAHIARGQAFFYEPSYYALYMTPFAVFSTLIYLHSAKEHRRISYLIWPNLFLLVSTSTGVFFSYFAMFACLLIPYFKRQLVGVSLLKSVLKFSAFCSGAFCLIWLIYPEIIKLGLLKFFYGGIKHASIGARWIANMHYLSAFRDHFWIGTGLGGSTTYVIKNIYGQDIAANDPNLLHHYIAMNVTTELLASLGVLGALAFAFFLYTVLDQFRQTLRLTQLTRQERVEVTALAISLCVLFFALQFNQSIMRAYVWIHVGMSIGYVKHLKYKYGDVLGFQVAAQKTG